MTNAEALKAIYTALGGSAGTGDTNADVLSAIYTVLGGEADTSGMTNAELIEAVSTVAQGGGGESDFRTCKVTFTNDAGKDVYFMMGPYINSDDEFFAGSVGIMQDETYILDAVLYKQQTNYIELEPSSNIEIEATGDVEVLEDYCDIMGDCTITFSGK